MVGTTSRRRRSVCGRGLCGGSGQDPRLQAYGRLHERDDLDKRRHHRTELRHLLVCLATGGQVCANRRCVGSLERPENEGAGHVADLVARQLPHDGWAAHDAPTSSARRIARSPRRIRLLTVPSGAPVRPAISCWVSPAK